MTSLHLNWRAKESNGAVLCNTLQRISIFMVLRYVYGLVQIVNSHLIKGDKNEIDNCWYICLVCFFHPTWRIFHSYRDVTITCEGLHCSTYTQHSWRCNNKGSLACHNYCITGHLTTTRDTHSCFWAFSRGAVTTCFNDLDLSQPVFARRMRG